MILLVAAALAAEVAPASAALQAALEGELARATVLKLPDAPAPWLVIFDALDGTVHEAGAEDGALYRSQHAPFRNLRVEVRVGDATVDSSNYSGFGEPDGIQSRRLPVEDGQVALRREAWLAADAAYKNAVETLSRKLAGRKGLKEAPPPDYQVLPPLVRPAGPHPGNAWSAPEVDDLARRLSAAASVDGVESAQAEVRDWHGWRLRLDSTGSRVWAATGNVVVRVEAVVRRDDGSEVRDARWWIGRDARSLPDAAAMESEARALATSLLETAAAPTPKPWLGPVIFEGEAAAELFSQLLAPELVGTRPEETAPGSFFAPGATPMARIGRRLLPEGWSAWDDPSTRTGAAGEYEIDHEGVAPRRVDTVVDGVVRDVLMSRLPSKERAASTGHGRALGNDRRGALPGFVRVTAPRMITDAAMRKRAMKLARSVGQEQVLVVRRLTPAAMVQSLEVSVSGEAPMAGLTAPYEACLLQVDGSCVPARNLRFVGVDRRLLRDIVAAAPGAGRIDMLDGPPGPSRYTIGTTGGVPTSWDVPSVLVSEVELDPADGGEPRVLRIGRAGAR